MIQFVLPPAIRICVGSVRVNHVGSDDDPTLVDPIEV